MASTREEARKEWPKQPIKEFKLLARGKNKRRLRDVEFAPTLEDAIDAHKERFPKREVTDAIEVIT